MKPSEQENLDEELEKLRVKYDPTRWQGEPQELVHSFDEVGRRYEGKIGEKVSNAAESFLRSRDSHLTPSERATLAINATDGQRERRLRELNNDPQWKRALVAIQNEHDRNAERVARQVEGVRAEVAKANGIDMEKTREVMRQEAQEAARAQAGRARERPPQELAVWDAAERRDARRGGRDYGPEM